MKSIIFFLLLTYSSLTLAQEAGNPQLLYCREDLSLTGVYPISDYRFLAVDQTYISIGSERLSGSLVRLIGVDGFSKDSIVFRGSILDIIIKNPNSAIISGSEAMHEIQIVDDNLMEKGEPLMMWDYKVMAAGEEVDGKGSVPVRKQKNFFKEEGKKRNKIRGIDGFGIHNGWLIMGDKNQSKKETKDQRIYSAINVQTNEIIRINPAEKKIDKRWENHSRDFQYWKRDVYFIGDLVYINSAETGKCYIFNTATSKVSFFRYPKSDDSLWFFTYDYLLKKQYLINYKNKKYDVYLFNGLEEKSIFITSLERFDHYIFNDSAIISKNEKGGQGNVYCFYRIPLYPPLGID
jgi:hypothetical protein